MKYEFFRDELGTIWFRDYIEIEAENYEDAKKKMIELEKSNNWDKYVVYTEPNIETWSAISVEERNGLRTIEIEDVETCETIWKNGE